MPASNGNYNIAKEYRRKYGTEMPTRKLARIMYEENNLSFNSYENARKALSYIEGKCGERHRKKVVDSEFYKEETRPVNPYKLPDSKAEAYEPYKLVAKRTLILNDIHFPFHEHTPLEAALNYAKKHDFDAILLNGDVMDFHGLSKFLKNPRAKKFNEELEIFRQFCDMLKVEFPKAKLYYKLGNHDERYQHFLWMKAKELDGVPEFEFENILQARAKGITVISDKRIVYVNDFAIMHGHEFPGSGYSPISPARSFFNRSVTNGAQGHNHQTSESIKNVLGKDPIITYSMGSLCGLHPQWMPINNWNWGFGDIEADINGSDYHFQNKRISLNGKVL